MYDLVQRGHVYVAQPPLFRVIKGKAKPYYVQTDEEMRAQLVERGVTDAELDLSPEDAAGQRPAGEASSAPSKLLVRGSKMEQLTRILVDMEEAIVGLERRGIS